LKRAKVVQCEQVEVEPFVWEDYLHSDSPRDLPDGKCREVSKKMLKALADEMGLSYDEKMLRFSKKLINYYVKQCI
jgi:hypothetical protein